MYKKKPNELPPSVFKLQNRDNQQTEDISPKYHDSFPANNESELLITGEEAYSQQMSYGNQLQKQYSVCPSIQNVLLDGYLEDLKYQIKLKSQALTTAEKFIVVLQEELKNFEIKGNELAHKLLKVEKINQQLQSQLSLLKNLKIEDNLKKSVSRTRTYTTEKNSPIEAPADQMKLISSEIFNQFALNFQSLINELSEWENRLKEDEISNSILNKLQVQSSEVESLLQGKSDDSSSKSTSQTLQLQSNNKRNNLMRPNSSRSYQQVIQAYKQLCNKLSILLSESMTCILQLSRNFEGSYSIYNQMMEPRALIPKDLLLIIIKQCKRISKGMLEQMKMQNIQLRNIVHQLIQWIGKNSKDRPLFFKYSTHIV